MDDGLHKDIIRAMELLVTNVLTVANEEGIAVPIAPNGNTQFFFRTPGNALADAAPIGTGVAFLSSRVRGFKVHVSVVDPLANSLVAQTVDIEKAAFSGNISAPNDTLLPTPTTSIPPATTTPSTWITLPAIRLTAKTLMGVLFWDSSGGT